MYVVSDYAPLSDTSDADVRVFLAAVKKYEPKTSLIETAESGFSSIINTAAALNALPASKMNGKSLLKWFKAARNKPSFLQSSYSCDHQYRLAPSLCRGGIQVAQYNDGSFRLVTRGWYDGMKYFTSVPSS
jgi:hypothetical protein